jgi:hypothetical protein
MLMDVIHNGARAYTLNEALAGQQGVTPAECATLGRLHQDKLALYDAMALTADPLELRRLAGLVTQTEFEMQKNWHFPLDASRHEWYAVPKCTCPTPLNTTEATRGYREHAMDCPVHGASPDPHAEPAQTFDLVAHLHRQKAFSLKTFGPGIRTEGVVDHIRKELAEILACPEDLMEWIDVVLLGLDGAWRSGAAPEQITAALAAKLAKNEARAWPDWRAVPVGTAIEHDRTGEVPAPDAPASVPCEKVGLGGAAPANPPLSPARP